MGDDTRKVHSPELNAALVQAATAAIESVRVDTAELQRQREELVRTHTETTKALDATSTLVHTLTAKARDVLKSDTTTQFDVEAISKLLYAVSDSAEGLSKSLLRVHKSLCGVRYESKLLRRELGLDPEGDDGDDDDDDEPAGDVGPLGKKSSTGRVGGN